MYMHNKKAFQSKANRQLANRCMQLHSEKKLNMSAEGWGWQSMAGLGVGRSPGEQLLTGPCIVTWGSPVNRQTWLKTLPSRIPLWAVIMGRTKRSQRLRLWCQCVTDCAFSKNIISSVFKSSNHLKELGSRNGDKKIFFQNNCNLL